MKGFRASVHKLPCIKGWQVSKQSQCHLSSRVEVLLLQGESPVSCLAFWVQLCVYVSTYTCSCICWLRRRKGKVHQHAHHHLSTNTATRGITVNCDELNNDKRQDNGQKKIIFLHQIRVLIITLKLKFLLILGKIE